MATPQEMQAFVEDLGAAFSSRLQVESERRADAAEEARERASVAVSRHDDVVATIDFLYTDRLAQTAADAHERAQFDTERKAEAAADSAERLAELASRHAEIVAELAEFHTDRLAQTAADAHDRAEFDTERKAEAAADSAERLADVASRHAEMAAELAELHTDRLAQTAADAHDRAEFDTERKADAAEEARERVADVASRHSEIAAELADLNADRMVVRADLLEVGKIWREHSVAVNHLRAGGGVSAPAATTKSPAKARSHHKATPDKAAAPKAAPPEAPAPAPAPTFAAPAFAPPAAVVEADPGTAATPAIFRYLANHPDGVAAFELEGHFAMSHVAMAQIMGEMIADNRVRREEKTGLYFAA